MRGSGSFFSFRRSLMGFASLPPIGKSKPPFANHWQRSVGNGRLPMENGKRKMMGGLLVLVLLGLGFAQPDSMKRAESNDDRNRMDYQAWRALRMATPGTEEWKANALDFERLGAASFAARRAAFERLLEVPVVDEATLRQRVQDPDPEVRRWARRLYDERRFGRKDTLSLALGRLSMVPLEWDSVYRVEIRDLLVAREAGRSELSVLGAMLRREDSAWIWEQLGRADAEELLRAELVGGLARWADSAEEVEALSGVAEGDRHGRVRLAAARRLARLGDRRCLWVLVDLAGDGKGPVGAGAVGLLRELTREEVSVEAGETVGEAWGGWLAAVGEEAVIWTVVPESMVRERLLVALWDEDVFVELDMSGKEVWRTKGDSATAVWGMPSGHRLVAAHSLTENVEEYDEWGRLVWTYPTVKQPIWVQRLPDGNTLIGYEEELVTVSPEKRVVQTVKIPDDRAWYCARWIRGGHYLVTQIGNEGLIELDGEGHIVWRLQTDTRLRDARRLPNGNTLVVELHGDVVEYGPDKREVWRKGDLAKPVSAVRLRDGRTRIATQKGLVEVDLEGRVREVISYAFEDVPNGACFY